MDSAALWDLPERRVPVGVAVSGGQSVERFALLADAMIAVQPEAELCSRWDAERSGGRQEQARKIGQLPVAWGRDTAEAKSRAREQFRWFAGGWKVNAELPGTQALAAATRFVTEDDVAAAIPCGASPQAIVEAARPFRQAGFTDLALVQVGGEHQDEFLDAAEAELLPALRETLG